MNEALRFIERVMLRQARLRFLIHMIDRGEVTGMELIDEGFRIPFASEFLYFNLLNKKVKNGKKVYSLTDEGREIAMAFQNLLDKVHTIVKEPEIEDK